MFKNILFLGIAILTLASCENFFATTLNVDPPPHTDQMVVHSYLNASDSAIYIGVGKSIALLENSNDLDQLNDASIEIYQGDQLLGAPQLRTNVEGNFYNYTLQLEDALSTYGDDFEIRVNHPSFTTATATQTLPTQVKPKELKYIDNAGLNEFGERTGGMDVVFDDPGGEKNFYEVSVIYIDTSYGQNFPSIEYLTSFDPTVRDGANYGTLIFDDTNFNGKEYTLRVQFQGERPADFILVNWRTLSEDQYLYSRSVRSFYNAQDSGPFGEPVSIYSNIENGLGIFGSANGKLYELDE